MLEQLTPHHLASSAMVSFCEKPHRGDLIEISFTDYQHWAIYVEDGYVIHLAPLNEPLGSHKHRFQNKFLIVKKELLEAMVGNCSYVVNSFLDGKYKRLPVKDIIHTTYKWLCFTSFVIIRRGAKDFVADLRYGLPKEQLEKVSLGLLDYPEYMRRPRLKKKKSKHQ